MSEHKRVRITSDGYIGTVELDGVPLQNGLAGCTLTVGHGELPRLVLDPVVVQSDTMVDGGPVQATVTPAVRTILLQIGWMPADEVSREYAKQLRFAADQIDAFAALDTVTVLERIAHDRDSHHLRMQASQLDSLEPPGPSRTDEQLAAQTAAVQARVTFDDGDAELTFIQHPRPVAAVAAFLRDLARPRTAQGWGSDELLAIAEQLDGGEGP